MALVDRDTRARSEKNRYSRNRCDIRSPPSRRQFATYERIYAAAARGEGVSKSEPEGGRRGKARRRRRRRKDTWTEPSVTYEYECGIGPYDMQPFAYI